MDKLASRKFLIVIVALALIIFGERFGLKYTPEQVVGIAVIVVGYLFGQGGLDCLDKVLAARTAPAQPAQSAQPMDQVAGLAVDAKPDEKPEAPALDLVTVLEMVLAKIKPESPTVAPTVAAAKETPNA